MAAIFLPGTLHAQVPQLLNYQGRVAVDGVNFDGDCQFKFALVNSDGTETYWSNDGTSTIGGEPDSAVTLPVAKGLYSVQLGDDSLANMTAVPPAVFANPDVRLRIWFDDGVNGSQLLAPDQRIAAVGYAMMAADVADESITAAKIAPASISGDRLAPGTLDFSLLQTPAAPEAGQVLGFDGTNFNWTAPGAGDGIWTANGASAYYNGGNIGIGTSTPSFKFVVADPGVAQIGFSPTYGIRSGYFGGNGNEQDGGDLQLQGGWSLYNGGRIRLGGNGRGDADRNVIQFFQNGVERMRINNGGNVGIGRIDPVTKLDIYDPGSVTERIETGGGTNASTLLQFGNLNGDWNIGMSRNFNGDQFYFARSGGGPQFSIQPDGDIAYVGKQNKLDTAEQATATVRAEDFLLGTTSRRGAPGRALVDFGSSLVVNFGNDWGTTTIGGAVTQVQTLQILGGADLAEPFPMSRQGMEGGTVVCIDPAHPGKLRESEGAYDKRVAGIVSGAGGIKPGISMIQENALEPGENVALSGRVYVRANANAGPIEPGDLLTTSDIPGEAMKAADSQRAQGAILGKAMTPLDETSGTVLVLVTLQ